MSAYEQDYILLAKILEQCCGLEFLHDEYDRSYELFLQNSAYHSAAADYLLLIGESVLQLSDEFKAENQLLPWEVFEQMNRISSSGLDILWNTAERETYALMEFCRQELADVPDLSTEDLMNSDYSLFV